jgi:hypothetical protein
MANDIKEVQEHIIELDGVRYRLACVTCMPKPQGHDSWCVLCDGNDRAPADDPDRYRLFDEYCHGYRRPLHCEPHYGIVYKRIDTPNAGADLRRKENDGHEEKRG